MTHKEKINYMRISAGICGIGFSNHEMDLLVSIYEEVIVKKGDTDLRGLSIIAAEVDKRNKLKPSKKK